MRVLIRTDAGGRFGLGHLMRMVALERALFYWGATVEFITEDTARVAEARGLACWDLSQCDEALSRADVLVIDTTAQDWANDASVLCRMREDRSVVRIDHPQAPPDTFDLLVGPCAHWDVDTVARLRTTCGDRFLYGWDYVMLDAEVTSHTRVTYPQRLRHGAIVFCAGGSDPDDCLAAMHTWIGETLPDVAKVCCYGTAYHGSLPRILPRRSWRAPTIVPFARVLLREAALAVMPFGQTVYECLFYGTPCLCFARTEADIPSVRALQEVLGLQIPLDYPLSWAALTPERFPALVEAYWDADVRAGMAQAGAGLIDGHGVGRVADAILALGRAYG
jgi:spore coat polysaccharide biosynthesis predicted glycosyltransferase SpsG